MPRFGPYKFEYSPPITLYFDSDEHTYLRQDGDQLTPVRGVTTVLKIIDKSEYLIPWAAKRVAEKVKETTPVQSDGLDDFLAAIPVEEFYRLVDAAKKAPREILEDAGNVGEQAHRALEDSIRFAIRNTDGQVHSLVNEPADPRAQSCCQAALHWMLRHRVRWVSTERKVYSLEYEFAGTTDGLAYVSSCADSVCCPVQFTDKPSIIDWKSSNQISITYLYQVAAYWMALHEEDPKLTEVDGFILRLGKEDGDFESWHMSTDDLYSDFIVFQYCLDLGRMHEKTKSRMATDSKARTVRKRAAAKQVKEDEKVAAKEAKAVLKAAKKKVAENASKS